MNAPDAGTRLEAALGGFPTQTSPAGASLRRTRRIAAGRCENRGRSIGYSTRRISACRVGKARTIATLLARATLHPSAAEDFRDADIETRSPSTPRRRNRGHARRCRQAGLRPAHRTRSDARGPAPRRRDLCYQLPEPQKLRPLTIPGTPRKIRGLEWSGRLDLNQRPLAPQAVKRPSQRLRSLRKRLQLLDNAIRQASSRHNESPAFLEILLPICCQIFRAASSSSSRCASSPSWSGSAPR